MLEGTNQETHMSISQQNQMRGKMISATKHRKESFKDMIEHQNSMEKPLDVMIGGDCDQDIVPIEL